ncbi:Scr1 family TA system antitoxin-like transcriptional regulator [Kitasatospora sp. NPDC057223]|uniref:Scr1 family TA system antitoxin-like transcriptional regulator n=1 Tax=Kitasatospora sp. NPDC057223 TaxID=3346055 RepID=UPI00363DC1F7
MPEAFVWMLRELRTRAGYDTCASLAREVNLSPSQVTKIESLERTPLRDFAERCDQVLRTGGQLTRAWDDVAWNAPVEHPDWFKFFANLEAQATLIRQFQVERITGLLQTPAYARALFKHAQPGADEATISNGVTARIGRQRRFLEPDGPVLVVILDEGVIRQHVGGRFVMHDQLRHLATVGERHPNVIIQIAPFQLGERTGKGGLTLLSLPDGTQWAYSESMSRGHVVNDPTTIEERTRAYDRLRAEALSAQDSVRLIQSVMRELVNMTPVAGPIEIPWQKQPRQWQTSTYSQGDGGECVEVALNLAAGEGVVPVRDSKDRQGPELAFTAAAWAAFTRSAAAGEFGTV